VWLFPKDLHTRLIKQHEPLLPGLDNAPLRLGKRKDDLFRRSLARPGGWAGFASRHKRGRRRSFAKTVRRLNASLLRRERLGALRRFH
jgi:hypothetical protein